MSDTNQGTYTRIFFGRRSIWLFVAVVLSITVLIVANYYTLKVSNSIRAYVHGESEYSKGQKNGCLDLILYIQTGKDSYYESYKDNIVIPHYDGLALQQLLKSSDTDDADIRDFFLQGGNHPDDIANLIWLFRTFRNVDFMENAINTWSEADNEINSLLLLGREIHKREVDSLSATQKQNYISKITDLSTELNIKEGRFSEILGETSRTIHDYLFWVNVLMVTFIFALLAWIYYRVMRDISVFQMELQRKNQNLSDSNQKLDQLIYATSHELKAPVNNIQGLVNVAKMDSADLNEFHTSVLDKIHLSLYSVTATIKDIENLMRLDNEPFNDFERIDLGEMLGSILIDEEVEREKADVEIIKNLRVNDVYFSRVGLRSILQNLILNAIKYRAHSRKLKVVIEAESVNDSIIIRVKDNGSGIDLEKHGDVLFDMFKRFHNNVPGSGLGLYAIKRIVERNGGSIAVESELGKGSVFTVQLKKM